MTYEFYISLQSHKKILNYQGQEINLSPELEHKSVQWNSAPPAILDPTHETFGRKAI